MPNIGEIFDVPRRLGRFWTFTMEWGV